MVGIIVFLIVVLPVLIKDKKEISGALISNTIITLIVFYYSFSIFKNEIALLKQNGFNGYIHRFVSDELSKIISITIGVLYLIADVFILITSLGMGQLKNKSRKLFFNSLFFIWIIFSLQFYIINKIGIGEIQDVSLFLSFVVNGIILLILLIALKNKSIKSLYTSKNELKPSDL